MKRFTTEEDQFIKDHYLILPGGTMDKLLDRPKGTVRQRTKLLGLIVPEDLKAKFQAENMYRKGQVPANKGVTQDKWMSEAGRKRIKETQFKSGRLPWNTKQKFEIGIRQKKGEKPYLVIYLNAHRPKYLHRYIWELTNGTIPKGYNIVFKDRNTLNCNIGNLELVSNADLLRRNSAHRFGPEIFKITQLRGALNRQINKRLKQLKNEK